MSRKRPESDFLKPIGTLRKSPSRRNVSSQGGPSPFWALASAATAVALVVWGGGDKPRNPQAADFSEKDTPALLVSDTAEEIIVPETPTSYEIERADAETLTASVDETAMNVRAAIEANASTTEILPLP